MLTFLGAYEWLWPVVMLDDDVAVDRDLKVDDPAKATPLQPAPRQGEEAFDHVHPQAEVGGEVEDPARVAEPARLAPSGACG